MAEDPDPGVPLSHYRRHRGAGVRLDCPECGASKTITLAQAIATCGEDAGVRTVASAATVPCACGAMRWTSRPNFRGGAWSDSP